MKEKTNDQEIQKQTQKSSKQFCLVGVGASAGGLKAFQKFIKAIPEDSGMAFVMVQHLDPDHVSQLPEILQRETKIPVQEIKDDVEVKPNHIYIIPSNKMLMAKDGSLELSPRNPKNEHKQNLPINLFLSSLSKVYTSHAVGVILSGSGSDGTEGLKNIKDNGGITFAQDEKSAEYNSMPKSAVDAGVVDFVLPPEKMPGKILEVTKTMKVGLVDEKGEDDNNEGKGSPKEEDAEVFKKILALLRIRKETDFTYYKQTTIRRRIRRRMALADKEDPVQYLEHLKDNKKEQDVLYQDLLIPVTSFFRDTKIFDNLCRSVFPDMVKNKEEKKPLRFWIAGCSTGEEVYSIAICLLEFINSSSAGSGTRIQIFGTDISEPAIDKARAGIYKKNELEGLSDERMQEYFTRTDGSYQVNKEVREICVFALHNLLKDPPFGKMDFISCRNVLIYMEPYLQKKALTTFHYALKPKGALLLGKSETISSVPELFAVTNKKDKLFSRKDAPSKHMPVTTKKKEQDFEEMSSSEKTGTKRTDFQKTADDIILNKYTPSGVVVNEAMDIVHFRGDTSKYLQQSPGKPTHNLLKMAKMGLSFELRNIVHKAKKELEKDSGEKSSVEKKGIPIEVNGKQQNIGIEAIPLPKLVEPHYLILFHGNQETLEEETPVKPEKDEKDLRIKQLEQELSQSREDMRSITEDQEVANEELQSANEELQSGGEELQSLNEELETSKEELESTNEELVSVNQELVNVNKRLTVARDFSEDIVSTLREPLLVLDKNLRVKSANKAFYKKFRQKESETEDKKIFELGKEQWDIPELRDLLEKILPEKSSFNDFEVTHHFPKIGQRTIILNAREIIREEGGEKLILLVFGDITDRRLAEINLGKSEVKFKVLAETIPQLIWITNPEGEVEFFNTQWEQYTGTSSEKSIKDNKWKSFLHPDDLIEFKEKWNKSRETGRQFSMEYRLKGAKGKYCWFLGKALPFYDTDGSVMKWFGSGTNIETQKEAEATLRKSEEHFRQLANLIPEKVSHSDANGKGVYYNQNWLDYTGSSISELEEDGQAKFLHPEELNEVKRKWQHSVETGRDFEMELRVLAKNNIYKWHLVRAAAVKDEEGKIKLWITTTTEIQKIKEEEKRKEDFLKMVSHELKTPVTSIKGYVQLLLSMLKQKKKIGPDSIPLESSLKRIDNQVSKLTRLISEMLDLSRIEEGKLELQKTSFSLNELVNETVQDINHTNTKHKINIHHDFKCKINADKDRIGQVLINFITNAVKYSPDNNTIDVSVLEAEGKKVAVSIKDRGIGIAKKDQKEIFNRFHRVSGKNEETYSGLGIGLFLAREIIIRHNGQIEVKSKLGEGSEFSFILPMEI